MIRILIIGVFLLNVNVFFAQSSNPMRIEIIEKGVENVVGIPLENKTLLILTHKEKRAPKGEHWVINIYNSVFFKVGNQNLYLPREFELFNYKLMNDSIVYLVFAEKDGYNSSVMIYRLNVRTNIIRHTYIKGARKARLLYLEYLKDKIFLIGNNMDGLQEQLKEIYLTKGIEIIAPNFPEYTNIIASYSNIAANKVIVMSSIYRGSNMGVFYNEFNGQDNISIKNQLHEADNISLIDGSLVESKGHALFFMGTFNYERGKIKDINKLVRVGTFFAKIVDGHFAFFKTNKFSDFTNLFSTLSYKDQVRVKENIKKGKNVDLNFRLLIHKEAIKQGEIYVLTAETYYPEYHYENNFDSRGYMYQTQVFDGYRTNNCIVAAFNENGRLVWDNYMHVDNIRSYRLHENILTFAEKDSSIVLAYYDNGKIKSKVVKGNEIVYKKSEDRVETVLNENILYESNSLIQYWYDNFFILSGYQTLYGRDGKKRKVFYFNLISFE